MITSRSNNTTTRQRVTIEKDRANNYANIVSQLPLYTTDSFTISLLDESEYKRLPHINSEELGIEEGQLYDLRMGPFNGYSCKLCGGSKSVCAVGHQGVIKLGTAVPHPNFYNRIIHILNSVCGKCGNTLLSEDEIKESEPNFDAMSKRSRLRRINDITVGKIKSVSSKPKCCDEPRIYVYTTRQFEQSSKFIKTMFSESGSKMEVTNAYTKYSEVYTILSNITSKAQELLGLPYQPVRYMRTYITVAPNPQRPKYEIAGEIQHHDLTMYYRNIIHANNEYISIPDNEANRSAKEDKSIEIYRNYNDMIVKAPESKNKVARDSVPIGTKLGGKFGDVRHRLLTKRSGYTGRYVISVAPDIEFGQIRIPRRIAENITKPVTVNNINIEECRNLIYMNKVNSVIKYRTGASINIRNKVRVGDMFSILSTIANELEVGDIIRRHMMDGDRVLFNRAPTIHQGSFQAHEVVISDEPSVGLHIANTHAYNADFDGDETHIHVTQTQEAEAEADFIMSTTQCMISAMDSKPLVGLIYDGLIGAYLLSAPNVSVSMSDTMNILVRICTPPSDRADTRVNTRIFTLMDIIKVCYKYYKHNIIPIMLDYSPNITEERVYQEYRAELRVPEIYEIMKYTGYNTLDEAKNAIATAVEDTDKLNDMITRITRIYNDRYQLGVMYLYRIFSILDEMDDFPEESMLPLKDSDGNLIPGFTELKTILRIRGVVLFSMILPENFNYTSKDLKMDEEGRITDGLRIVNQVILDGSRLKKNNVGTTSGSIMHILHRLYSIDHAVTFITQASWLVDEFLALYGYSMDLFSCYPKTFYRPGQTSGFLIYTFISMLREYNGNLEDLFNEKIMSNFIDETINIAIEDANAAYVPMPENKRDLYVSILEELASTATREALYRNRRYEEYQNIKTQIETVSDEIIEEFQREIRYEELQDTLSELRIKASEDPENKKLQEDITSVLDELSIIKPIFHINDYIDLIINILDYRKEIDDLIEETQIKIREKTKNIEASTSNTERIEELKEREIIRLIDNLTVKIRNLNTKIYNPKLYMSQSIVSGAKGDISNAMQIGIAMTQQYISNKRMEINAHGQCLAYYYSNTGDADIAARGFCDADLIRGLPPGQAFAHQTAGREGLINSANTVQKAGDNGRKIRNMNVDKTIGELGTVVNSNRDIVQFGYLTGCKPMGLIRMHGVMSAVDIGSLCRYGEREIHKKLKTTIDYI
jgi:DNA-directed RNA polymerase beta' subunit